MLAPFYLARPPPCAKVYGGGVLVALFSADSARDHRQTRSAEPRHAHTSSSSGMIPPLTLQGDDVHARKQLSKVALLGVGFITVVLWPWT